MSNVRFRPVNSFPPIVKNLIIINVLAWLAQLTLDRQYQITGHGALWPVNSPFFEPYQVFTSMFLHSPSVDTIYHILFNMLGLYMFGRVLESVWGGKRFLLFYLICGLGAAGAHLLMQYYMGNGVPAIGASGAIMGVLVAFAYLFPNVQLLIMPIPFPIRAKWAVLGYAVIDLIGGLGNIKGDDIAHFAHLGGAITGFIILLIWNKTNRRTLY